MIVVTGVTGQLGRIAIEDLLTRVPADQLVAVARAPGKAADLVERGVHVRRGNYEDPGGLRTAFAGADILLLVSSPDATPGVRPRQHGNAITAAKDAGVGRIVYTSGIGAQAGEGFLADHTVTERLLRESGVRYTALRNTFYTEAFVHPGLLAAVEAGELLAADDGRPVHSATRADLARAASAVLTADAPAEVYELRGPGWTYAELAEVLSEEAGRPVAYRPVPVEETGEAGFVHQLVAAGFFAEPAPDLDTLLGRPPAGIREAVRALLATS